MRVVGEGVGLEGLRKGRESWEGDFSKSRRKTATGCGRDLKPKHLWESENNFPFSFFCGAGGGGLSLKPVPDINKTCGKILNTVFFFA